MRFQVNLDCTPEEARQFFGLPDIIPMQQAIMEELSKRMAEGIHTMEPDVLMKTWVPALFQGLSQMQQNWWTQMSNMSPGKFSSSFSPDSPEEDEEEDSFSSSRSRSRKKSR
jgi:hypothetical protein